MFKSKEERINAYNELKAEYDFGFGVLDADGLEKLGFFTAPASIQYHGNYEGGLFDHSLSVYLRLKEFTTNNDLLWQRPQSPFIVGMFHDLCKCDQYVKKDGAYLIGRNTLAVGEDLYHYEYNAKTILKGHGTKSVILLSQFIVLTEEEILCIRYHMGAYGSEQEQDDEWSGFDMASIKTNGLCLWTHMADQLASKIDGV